MYTKVFHFNVLYSDAWIAKSETGEHILIMQDHGIEYIAPKEHLVERIEEYYQAIFSSEKALKLLEI